MALPLGAVKKPATSRQDDAHPVVAAAAISAPRKGSEQSFLLDRATLDILQSDDAQHADAKATLLKDPQKAVSLRLDNIELPLEVTQLLKPFVNVRTLDMHDITGSQLPYLPCPQKLERLSCLWSPFRGLKHLNAYPNIMILKLQGQLLQSNAYTLPDQEKRFITLLSLKTLHTLDYEHALTLILQLPEHRQFLTTFIQNNPHLEHFHFAGPLTADMLKGQQPLPLRTLSLKNTSIEDAGLPFLSLQQLEVLRLLNNDKLHTLTALQNAPVRVLDLSHNTHLDLSLPLVIAIMPRLEELFLEQCDLVDAHVEPLLSLASQLKLLNRAGNARLSQYIRQQLSEAFGEKVHFNDPAALNAQAAF